MQKLGLIHYTGLYINVIMQCGRHQKYTQVALRAVPCEKFQGPKAGFKNKFIYNRNKNNILI